MSNNRRKAAGGRDRIRKSRLKAYMLTAVFTLLIAVILIQQLGMYPFGDHHLCYSDADQYYGFYGYLMSTFFSGNDLFYSWSMALGNGMLSTYAYYTASPLNLLLVFFRKDLMLGMHVIVFIRTFLISLSFCALLNDCGPGREVEKAILSASYAFIGYTAFYAWNASWMDGVALLPLMVLGLKNLLDRRQKLVWSEYTGHAPRSTDDFLGIRYILNDYELKNKPYKELNNVNGTRIFENPDALPLIFETRELYEDNEKDNDFEFQNGFYRSFDRDRLIDADIFEKAEYDREVSEDGENCLAEITVEASPSDLFYMQLPEMERMDELGCRFSLHNYLGDKELEYTSARDIYCLGKPDEDGKIIAEIGLDRASDRHGIKIYRLREDVLSAYVSRIQADQSVDVKEITSSHLKFESDRKEDALYTSSIPYDKGWRVTVDGRKVKTQENAGCFLSFPVEAGKHTVELRYRPKGLGAGIAVSVLALLILVRSEYAARPPRNGDRNVRKSKNRKKARPHKRRKTQKRTRPAGDRTSESRVSDRRVHTGL